MLEAYTEGLRPLLAAGRYDIVHAQDCLSANAALALRDEGVIDHVLRTVHHVDDFTSPSLIECQDRSIIAPDHVLCVSAPWVERLRAEFGVSAGLVPNGVDAHRFRPPRDAAERADARRRAGVEDRLAVLTVGGVEPRKGSLTLLEGFARAARALPVPRPAAADRGRRRRCSTTATSSTASTRASRELDLTRHVRRLGALEPDEIERLYRAADVFAFPSVKEGFGLAALEALAAGLPLVASDLDVFRGFLTDGESALLHPVGDAAALAAALERVARDPELRRPPARGRRARSSAASAGTRRARRTRRPTSASGASRGEGVEVTATFHGGYAATVDARGPRDRGRRARVTPAATTAA